MSLKHEPASVPQHISGQREGTYHMRITFLPVHHTLNPALYTLHSTPYTLHSYTLHPTP